MDRVYMENIGRYQTLINAYTPPKVGVKEAETVPNPDMTVSARIRPLLEDELSAGIVPGVFLRDQATTSVPVIDLHELRKTVRRGPQINVSCSSNMNWPLDIIEQCSLARTWLTFL